MHAGTWLLALVAFAALGGAAQAQTVSMSGSLGDKALLVIDGMPRTVATGSTVGLVENARYGATPPEIVSAIDDAFAALGVAEADFEPVGDQSH